MAIALSRRHTLALGLFSPVWAAACSNTEETLDDGELDAEELSAKDALLANASIEEAFLKEQEVDDRLARASRVRVLLSPEEMKKFTDTFHEQPDVVAVHEKSISAAEKLNDAVSQLTANDTAIARVMAPVTQPARGQATPVYGAKGLYNSMRLLAKTVHASKAFFFGLSLFAKDPRYAKVFESGDYVQADMVDEILFPSLTQITIDRAAEGGTIKRVIQAIFDAIETKEPALRSAILAADSPVGYLKRVLEAIDADPQRVEATISKAPKRMHAHLGAITVILAFYELGDLAESVRKDSWKKVFEKAARSVGPIADGLDAATTILKAHAVRTACFKLVLKQSKTMQKTGLKLLRFAETVGQLAAGLGVLIDVFDLMNTKDPFSKTSKMVAVVGNVVAIAGSILSLAGVAAAGPIGLVAAGIGMFALWLEKREEEAETRADLKACLTPLGFNDAQVETSFRVDLRRVERMRALTLDTNDIRFFVKELPRVITNSSNEVNLESFEMMPLWFGKNKASCMQWLRSIADDPSATVKERQRMGVLSFMDRKYAFVARQVPGGIADKKSFFLKELDAQIAASQGPFTRPFQSTKTFLLQA
jgi:hypothetical protein